MVQRLPVALTADQAQPKTAEQPEPWLEAAFRQHWSRVYGVLFRLVGDGDEAEDLALETFWRLYRRSPVLDENKLGGWLYRVATNLGFNALRSRRRRQQYEARAGASALEQGKPDRPGAGAGANPGTPAGANGSRTHETALCQAAGICATRTCLMPRSPRRSGWRQAPWAPCWLAPKPNSSATTAAWKEDKRCTYPMENCAAYLDHQPGRLTTEQAKAHLAACDRCRSRLESLSGRAEEVSHT